MYGFDEAMLVQTNQLPPLKEGELVVLTYAAAAAFASGVIFR